MAERGTAGREKVWCVCGDEGGWSRRWFAGLMGEGTWKGCGSALHWREEGKKSEPLGRHSRRLEKKKNEGGGAGDSSFFVRERKRTLVF